MNETSNWLIHDHHKYDTVLEECELEAGAREWKKELGDPEGAITELKVFRRTGSDPLLLHRDEIMIRLKSLPGVEGRRTLEF